MNLTSVRPMKFSNLILATALGGLLLNAIPASAVPYVPGDLFVGTTNGIVKHYTASGVFLENLNTTLSNPFDTGMCFDAPGNLYGTDFDPFITKWDNAGNLIAAKWATNSGSSLESCAWNAASALVYVGGPGNPRILVFDATGALVATYTVASPDGTGGTDWVDLAADQSTIYYTNEGPTIRRFDTLTNTQLPNFATITGARCFALRIRPGTNEVMVACGAHAYRLDALGMVLQTYTISGESDLFALNLDPDNTSFWTASAGGANVYKVDISTGAVLQTVSTGAQVWGLALFGELTAGGPKPATLTLTPTTSTNKVGTQHCVTATVTDASGKPVPNVSVVFSVSGANSAGGTFTTDANGQATFCYTGTHVGTDLIHAFADTNGNGTEDAGEPFGDATKIWTPGTPATLTLAPPAATNTVGTTHCVTATVKDVFGNPVPGVTVVFTVQGAVLTNAVPASGSAKTNAGSIGSGSCR